MANPNAIVSRVIGLEPPLERAPAELLRTEGGLSVNLDGGRRVHLDASDPRSAGFAHVLDGLSKQGLLAYLEIDPTTSAITPLLIPHVTHVESLVPTDEGNVRVELAYSHALHVLRASQPDYVDLKGQLDEAVRDRRPVILTEDDAHNVIDVRFFRPGPDGPLPDFPEPALPHLPWPLLRVWDYWKWIWRWRWWPWWWFRCSSMAKAQQIFDAMSATSCNPLTVPVPCIPFLYPDDGCWARAHEMCRLMINLGLSPMKVWIQASTRLHVNTKNNPACFVEWGWHVAPTLCVRGPGFFQTQEMVVDPSLFKSPVSQSTWKSVQGDPNATLTSTDASIYWLWTSGTDPTYADTNQKLAFYRLQLQNRAIQYGAPPYANCP